MALSVGIKNRRQPLECGGFDAAFPPLDLSTARFTTGKAASKPPHSKASRASTLNLTPLALKRRSRFKPSLRDEETPLFATTARLFAPESDQRIDLCGPSRRR